MSANSHAAEETEERLEPYPSFSELEKEGANEPTSRPLASGSLHWLVRQLGSRWAFAILDALRGGAMRFAKLKRALDPISQRMLTFSLRKLERDGLVHREETAGQPPQVSYELTPLGASLLAQLTALDSWLKSNQDKILKANARFRGLKSGQR